jgi:transposase InsO family protein
MTGSDGGAKEGTSYNSSVKEGTLLWPMLTRTNYSEWAMLMQCNYEALEIWEVIDPGTNPKRSQDRQAMSALLRSVPKEMWTTLGRKKTVKEAWEAVKTMRIGADRVKDVNAQKLLQEFENISFKDGETVDDFGMRINNLVANLKTLGETVEETRVVKKFLRVVPTKFTQVVVSIEMFCDMKVMTVEELVGRLRAAEDRMEEKVDQIVDKTGRLLMAEEDWLAKNRHRFQSNSSSSSGVGGGHGKGKTSFKPEGGSGSGGNGTVKLTSEGTPRRKGRCHNCGIYGHWAQDCKRPKKERKERKEEKKEAANVAVADAEHSVLLMATTCDVVRLSKTVHLAEDKFVPIDCVEGVWVLDTCASNHMTGTRAAFSRLDGSVTGTVRFGDGSCVAIEGLSSIVLEGRDHQHKVLTNVYYIPKLKSNIISLGQLEETGCDVRLWNGRLTVVDPEGTLVMSAPRTRNRLYTLKPAVVSPVCLHMNMDDESWKWHSRFGHLNFRALRELGRKNMVEGMPIVDRVEQVCDGCTLGKQHRKPFPQSSSFRAAQSLELVHTDLCGQINPPTPGGKSYFLLVVDDHSRYMWVELLKTKDEALLHLKKFKQQAELELGKKLKALRTDRGGEFNSRVFTVFCDETGIKHYTTTPYTPQQNGVVERRNQTVIEMARCMMKSKGVPPRFWGEAVKTAVYILNRAPTKCLQDKTPYEVWHGRKPRVDHMRTFGCVVHVKVAGPGVTKLSDRSTKMVFLGYELGTKGYRAFDPISQRVVVSRDVVFEEKLSWDWGSQGVDGQTEPETFSVEFQTTVVDPTIQVPAVSGDTNDDTRSQTGQGGPGSPQASTPAGSRIPTAPPTPVTPGAQSVAGLVGSGPQSAPAAIGSGSEQGPVRYRTLADLFDNTEELVDYEYSGLCFLASEEPASVEEAMKQQCWKDAMDAELKSITDNNTWTMAELPKGQQAIGLKWVFKVKKDPAGNVVKHKARLVAKGYAQKQGIDYDEVFAPVARIETVRVLLALAASGGWEVHHMDVKSAFLNGDLLEEVYVHQPPGFIDPKEAGKVLFLNKALYGLKQAPRAWNSKLDQELCNLGFRKCEEEHAVYRRSEGSSFLLVGVYVDDLIICGPDSSMIATFKQQMMSLFSVSDLGLLSYYLGIEVVQGSGEITISQSAYAKKIVEQCGMTGCNPTDTPMEERTKLVTGTAEKVLDASRYRSVIGSLRYLVNTRPDIGFAVGMASRFMESPNQEHWAAVKRIVRYVAGTINYGCRYTSGGTAGLKLLGYTDSDHGGDLVLRRSTTGMVFFLGSNLVTWTSQKQKSVALSSCEAEYMAAAAGACQGVWLSRLVAELMGCDVQKFSLLIDNKAAIELSKNPVFHERSKHIDTRYHYIRECVSNVWVDVDHVRTDNQIADILTKALGRIRFVELRQKLGIVKT